MAKIIRQDINGLKAIAIVLVVLYHFFDLINGTSQSNITLFSGGFIGVDVFLVVSGFLITSGIVYKFRNDDFSLGAFYKRRLLRIIPPVLFLCIFVLIAGYFLLFPDIYRETAIEVGNTLLFIGNFRFANSGGYFSLESSDRILLHTWYLCITVQFYILYPLILLLIKKIFGLNRLGAALAAITVLLIITAHFASLSGKGYLLTQCRIWEMFVGGTLYIYSDKLNALIAKAKAGASYFEITGTIFILLNVYYVDIADGVWLVSTSALAVLGTCLVLAANAKSSIYNSKVFTVLGQSSYSLYIWHWPLFVFVIRLGVSTDVFSICALLAALALIVYLSYIFLEKKQLNSIAVLCIYFALLGAYGYIKSHDGCNYLSYYVNASKEARLKATNEKFKNVNANLAFVEDNTYIFGDNSKTPEIFIIGDSHTGHYSSFLRDINKTPVYVYSYAANMAYGSYFANLESTVFDVHKDGRNKYFTAYKMMLDTLPDGNKVVLANNWYVHYKPYLQANSLKQNTENFDNYVKIMISDIDEEIKTHPNLEFYIVNQGIYTSKTKVICSQVDLSESFLSKIMDQESCKVTQDFLGDKGQKINDAFDEYAKDKKNVHIINRNKILEIEPGLYKTIYDGFPVFDDSNHYTPYGGAIVGEYIMESLK